MVLLSLNKTSFHNTETIKIELDFSNTGIDFKNIKSLTVRIYKVDIERNEFATGFGQSITVNENKVYFERKLTDQLKDGVYFIHSFSWMDEKITKSILVQSDFELKYFCISKNSEDTSKTNQEIESEVKQILIERRQYRNFTLVTNTVKENSNGNNFKVLIFCSGSLIQNIQELQGITIYPITNSIDYSSLSNPVETTLKKRFGITLPQKIKVNDEIKKVNPLFVIEFFNVLANSNNDALLFCNTMVENIFSILAFSKGQRPTQFAYSIIENGKQIQCGVQFPSKYSGNIISDFSSTTLVKKIDKLGAKFEKEPLVKFLFDSYSFALNELNPDIKCLRLWTILNFIADSQVPSELKLFDARKNAILNKKNEHITTEKIFDKIYYLIFNSSLTQSTVDNSITGQKVIFEINLAMDNKEYEVISLWDFLSAAYEIRNKVAHVGRFDIMKYKSQGRYMLAVKYYNLIINQLDSVVKRIIEIESNRS